MTKFEVLQNLKKNGELNRLRDLWLLSGGSLIRPYTNTFNKGVLYRIALNQNGGDPTTTNYIPLTNVELDGSIVYCEEVPPLNQPYDFTNQSLYDIEEGLIINESQILSPHFRLVLTNNEFNSITIPFDPNYKILGQDEEALVKIPDSELELILSEVGVPFIRLEELEFTKSKIINNMVLPALQTYFKYFPIKKPETDYVAEVFSGQKFEIKFPDKAFGVVRCCIIGTGKSMVGPTSPLSFFLSEVAMNPNLKTKSFNTARGWSAGIGDDINGVLLRNAARQGMSNYITRVKFYIDKRGKDKYLRGFCNRAGLLEIVWAFWEPDWDFIDFNRLPEVRALAAAYVLRALAVVRGQVRQSDITFDTSMFLNRAAALEEISVKFWSSLPQTAAVIRG